MIGIQRYDPEGENVLLWLKNLTGMLSVTQNKLKWRVGLNNLKLLCKVVIEEYFTIEITNINIT